MMLRTLLISCALSFGLLPTLGQAKPPPGVIAEFIVLADLPVEARKTLILIKAGGPFPYDKDGVVFGNRERVLPKQVRGYYTEYTVKTPGAKNRGARRIIAGGQPKTSGEYYYTDDHYSSFKRIQE
jgi:ribonuclease T1